MLLRKSTSSFSSQSLPRLSLDEVDVLHEGWLKKKGHLFSTVKSRYFQLTADGRLAYFKDEKCKKQKGMVLLGMSDSVVFGFELRKESSPDHNAKAYAMTMFAASEDERTKWIEMLRRAASALMPPTTQRPMSPMARAAIVATVNLGTVASNPRETFCVLIEMGELQNLVALAKDTWDADPLKWRHDQYLELCQSIVFTHEKAMGANLNLNESQVMQDALELRYKYEDAQAQLQARRLSVTTPMSPLPQSSKAEVAAASPHSTDLPVVEEEMKLDPAPKLSLKIAKYFATLDPGFVAFSPRSKTMAKYAHFYQEEALTAKRAWNIQREESDDLLNMTSVPRTTDDIARVLQERFERDRIYTSVGDTMIAINPAPRLVHHVAGNSIYDETTVMWYRDHNFASCSPHPFALAKRTLSSVQDNQQNECIILIGESGSGKSDFAKHVLKYIAMIQCASKPPRVQLYTSSTKSTIKMRSDESHLEDLLRLKQVTYETIYLDIYPEKWNQMLSASGGMKQLPQLHMDGLFFGNYDELQRLEDEEQFVFYVRNPAAARLTSVLLDGNVLLEAFGNAKTIHNPNSSRFGKSTSFSIDSTTGLLLGGSITPFFLESSRVTNINADDANFHIFYSLLVGASDTLAVDCHLKNTTPASFKYLGKPSKAAPANVRNFTTEEDRQRWNRVLRCLDLVGVTETERNAIFYALSAVLHLGNFSFEDTHNKLGVATGVRISSELELKTVASLLSIEPTAIEHTMCTKQLSVTKMDEVYELQVHSRQASITRHSFARLLYESLFSTLVTLLNRSSMASNGTHGNTREITLVDVFGFEDLGFNSLEQLCINYLTEKLSAFELEYAGEVQGALYFAEGLEKHWKSVLNMSEGPGLEVMDSPVGVWACLDEATLLHANEDDPKQTKNSRFVRALYSRNVDHAGLSVQRDPLEFTVNHVRSPVTYNVTDFVSKNSDDVLMPLVRLIRTSTNQFIKELLPELPQTQHINTAKRNSVANRFKGHVQSVLNKLREDEPRFVHCLRPRLATSTDFSSLDVEVLGSQVQGQLLSPVVTFASQLFRHHMTYDVFNSQYRVIFSGKYTNYPSISTTLKKKLTRYNVMFPPFKIIRGSLNRYQHHDRVFYSAYEFAVGNSAIFFNEMLYVQLQSKRLQLRTSACIRMQATVRMWLAKRFVEKLREATRNYIRDITQFYAKYNPTKMAEVPGIVRAFRGRESILFQKLQQKYLKDHAMPVVHEQKDTSLEDFILKVHFDAPTVQQMLLNPKMALLLSEPRILQALREVSIDPSVIYLQTSDPVLRLFYSELRLYFTPNIDPNRVEYQNMPLEEAIHKLSHLQLLRPTADMTPEEHTIISEIALDPALLAFHIDQPGVRSMLEQLIKYFKTKNALNKMLHRAIDKDPNTLVVEARVHRIQPVRSPNEPQQEPPAADIPVIPSPEATSQVAEANHVDLEHSDSTTPVAPPSHELPQSGNDVLIFAHSSPHFPMSKDVDQLSSLVNMSSFEAEAIASASYCPEPSTSIQRFQDLPLQLAVERLIEAHLLCPTNDMSPEDQAIVLEISNDPALLVFHIDDPHVRELLANMCCLVDALMAQTSPLSVATPETQQPSSDHVSHREVEFKRVKVTKKLMKKIMKDDTTMGMMGDPKVLEFFEEFSEDTSEQPTIVFQASEALLIDFYKAVLGLAQA
ncbi:Aste57867_10559 [Aphanomyces stellatus]|uniref:Aste57867_10559 protein n=1 Tax=Aphanomyces stellatus TaxID=120398 RepID=A0A485KQQ0_9STRA|nr:hypothetical protein As57867_010519 [Aphanomyces stellatus]VFT87432.1 Aste57867_10559 [Aphanomyces stellatus]